LQSFFTGGGLGNQQVIQIHAELAGVLGIEGVLDVDEGGEAAALLRLGNDGERERGLTRGFRAEHFHNPAAGETANPESAVDQQVPGGDDIDIDAAVIAEAHDRRFTELLLDVGDREIQIAFAGFVELFVCGFFRGLFGGHGNVSSCKTFGAYRRQTQEKDVRSNKKLPSRRSVDLGPADHLPPKSGPEFTVYRALGEAS